MLNKIKKNEKKITNYSYNYSSTYCFEVLNYSFYSFILNCKVSIFFSNEILSSLKLIFYKLSLFSNSVFLSFNSNNFVLYC